MANLKSYLEEIEKDDKKGKRINAFIQLNPEAKETGKGKLAGKVIAIKSNINVKGLNASCASQTLKDYTCPYDATVIEKIKKEGGIIIGMTNMDEFACGSSGETSAYLPTRNPRNLDKIPGGSSSGSAAAVAAGFCDMALGSDTGGSIRNPASHCGIVGVKPTYGLVSRYGLIDLSMSLDQIGCFAKNVQDALLLLEVIRGKDSRDATSVASKEIKFSKLGKITIGMPKINIQDKRISELIKTQVEKVANKNGWKIQEFELKHINLAVQTYYPICYVEFFSGTRKFDGRRYGAKIEEVCGPEVLRRILGGSEISKAEFKGLYYRRALKAKELVKKEFESAFKKFDCIIMPTVPRLPHKIGEKLAIEEMYAYDALTIPANLAELPAISIPAGDIEEVPVGLQVYCPRFEEGRMFSIAKEFETNLR